MNMDRRALLKGLAAAPAAVSMSGFSHAADAKVIKISHQFPGGTAEEGDFRDRLTRKFASEVEKRTNGSLTFEIYPGSSLVKTVAQFSALRKGALDMSLYPLAYAGGEVQELNIGLMPCMVTSYDQGFAWKKAEIGRELTKLLEAKGVTPAQLSREALIPKSTISEVLAKKKPLSRQMIRKLADYFQTLCQPLWRRRDLHTANDSRGVTRTKIGIKDFN